MKQAILWGTHFYFLLADPKTFTLIICEFLSEVLILHHSTDSDVIQYLMVNKETHSSSFQ